jgi:hypothetical protein
MPPVRERPKSAKVRENKSTAALLRTPRATLRAPSRPRAPARTPSRAKTLQTARGSQSALLTPEDRAQGTQVVRDSASPPAQPLPRYSSSDFPPSPDPISDIEIPDI